MYFNLKRTSAPIFLAVVLVCCLLQAATGSELTLEMFMHDIVGGRNPTARPISGLLGNIYSGQVPFARPIGFLPPKGGVPILNANGAIPTTFNDIPLGTGLLGTSFAGNIKTQMGPDGLGLGFGTITAIDDILTSGAEIESQAIGKAQGIYVASSMLGTMQMMAFTTVFEGGEYRDSLNFFGVYKIGSPLSRLSVTRGTGKFKNACGFAEMRSLYPPRNGKL